MLQPQNGILKQKPQRGLRQLGLHPKKGKQPQFENPNLLQQPLSKPRSGKQRHLSQKL
jgi:hypothetical protein